MTQPKVATGLERIAIGDDEAIAAVRGRAIGLVAHPASVTSRFVHAHRVLVEAGARVVALFGPEHGYGGEAQDMIGVKSSASTEAGAVVPIYSLYGPDESWLAPRPEQLEGLDALVIDLQDIGSRYYTFVWTAALCLRAAAAQGVATIVLDRPNPLGGEIVEGAPQREGYRSFVGLYPVAVRHAMTIGEIAKMVRAAERIDDAALTVVRMKAWERAMDHAATELPWVLPSPNMPTFDTARVYPGGCLIEGTNLSEGRGTTRPFEIFGAPFVDGAALAREVAIEGAILRPITFEPTFHKHAKQTCGGVQVHVTDPSTFAAYPAYLRLIEAIARMAADRFALRTEPYEFVKSRPAIDLLTGGPEFRQALRTGAIDEVLAREAEGAAAFGELARGFHLY